MITQNEFMKSETLKHLAADSIRLQAKALHRIADAVDDSMVLAVNKIAQSTGRVVITGIGKSAIIAQKIVATFNSTGTPALFMHAADAIHGDLGMIQSEDVVIAISKSGETPEIRTLVPFLKQQNGFLIAITGNTASYLAQQADACLDAWVEREVCQNNMAPTTSTTAQLILGDALAVCLQEIKGFKKEDFAKYHPGGSLGKKMFLRVNDLIRTNNKPEVHPLSNIKDTIGEISAKRLGAVVVTDKENIVGIITDGDIRRMLEHNDTLSTLCAKDIMSPSPLVVERNLLASEALNLMRERSITQLIVVDTGQYYGIIHLHDILNEGIE